MSDKLTPSKLKEQLQCTLGQIIQEDRHFEFTETLIDIICEQQRALEDMSYWHCSACMDNQKLRDAALAATNAKLKALGV